MQAEETACIHSKSRLGLQPPHPHPHPGRGPDPFLRQHPAPNLGVSLSVFAQPSLRSRLAMRTLAVRFPAFWHCSAFRPSSCPPKGCPPDLRRD